MIHGRIDIPNREPGPEANAAAKIVTRALLDCGLDPWKAVHVPMIIHLCRQWAYGKISREQFMDNCRKVAILNDSIRL